MFSKMTRYTALLVLFALMLSIGSAVATELIGECDDCCEESNCNDCVFCWCCSAVPVAVTPEIREQKVNHQCDMIEIVVEQDLESLSLELLDPPPRS